MRYTWLVVLTLVLISTGLVQADMVLTLDVESGGQYSLNGSPFTPATIEVQAVFDQTKPIPEGTGANVYTPTSVTAWYNGTEFDSNSPESYFLVLVDGSNTDNPGAYTGVLSEGIAGGFIPFYSGTTTGGWTVTDPTPTTFTGYTGSNASNLFLSNGGGANQLSLTYGPAIGITSSLDNLPLPSAVAMGGVWGVVGVLGLVATRRWKHKNPLRYAEGR